MNPILNRLMPVEPLEQNQIDRCEGLFDKDYYAEVTRPCDRRIGALPHVLESYDVDKRRWKEVPRDDIQKCFDDFREILTEKNGFYSHAQYSYTTTRDKYPIAAGLFWRVLCRKEERITAEKIRKMPIPKYLNKYQKSVWEAEAKRGRLPILGVVLKDLTTIFRADVLEKVYAEMKEKFDKEEDWVFSPLYERKIEDKRKMLEAGRDTSVKNRILLTVYLTALVVFFRLITRGSPASISGGSST